MKILITILLALFISSQAYADDESEGAYEVCKHLDDELVTYANQIKKYKESTVKLRKDDDATIEQKVYSIKKNNELIDKMEEFIKEISQTYYNLSCVEVLRR